jgi:hypothetical protein
VANQIPDDILHDAELNGAIDGTSDQQNSLPYGRVKG